MRRVWSVLRGLLARDETPIAPRSGVIGALIILVSLAMAFLAVAAFEAGSIANRVAGQWSSELAKSATVRISAPSAELDGLSRAVLSTLEIAPGVAGARRMSEAELQALLAPWLGGGADVGALPLPALIDVTVEDPGPDVEDVQRQLDLVAPGAVYDDHGEWRAPLIRAARDLRIVAAAGVALTFFALAAMVGIAAAASLWSGSSAVRTLRLIGAEDRFISRAFERPFALRAAFGATIGAAAALFAAARAPRPVAFDILAEGASAGGGPNVWLIAATPAIAAITALFATRAASFFVLRRTV